MTQERNEAHEIGHGSAAYPMKGCRKRLAYHDHERYGRYRDIKLADAARVLDMTLSPEGIPARKTYVTCPNGKHSRWVVALDGLRMLKDRHPSLIGKSKIAALIVWAIQNGVSETLWPESTIPVAITPQPTVEVVAEEPAVPVEMPKWDGKGSPFDAIREFDEHKREFWSARRLMSPLGYSRWQEFEAAIERAVLACRNSGQSESDHMWGATRMAPIGSGAVREIRDWRLSRFGAYLVAMNGDPRKPEIAAAQQYFAIRTHQAERAEEKVNSSDFKSMFEALRMLTVIAQGHSGSIAALTTKADAIQGDLDTVRLRASKALELAEHVQDRMNGLAGPFTIRQWCQKHGYRMGTREARLLGMFLRHEAEQRNRASKKTDPDGPEPYPWNKVPAGSNYMAHTYPLAYLQEFDRYLADYKKHEHEWIGVARTIEAARRKADDAKKRADQDGQHRQPHLF